MSVANVPTADDELVKLKPRAQKINNNISHAIHNEQFYDRLPADIQYKLAHYRSQIDLLLRRIENREKGVSNHFYINPVQKYDVLLHEIEYSPAYITITLHEHPWNQ